tara:strand:+ start:149 stop:868 length:720 start_codon:yes stop_codon:yes gene_type:complete
MKIAVLMWFDDAVSYYADNCYKINKAYCNKYNYDLIKSSVRVYGDKTCINPRNPHWERFPLILKHIEKYDYVIWIDADAFFYFDSPPIEKIINEYDNKEILFSADHSQLSPPAINTGVLILKNTQRVIDIVKKWAYSEDLKNKYCGHKYQEGLLLPKKNWIEDQGLIRGFVRDNVDDINSISRLIPYLRLQHYLPEEKKALVNLKNQPYIMHFAGNPDVRYEQSKHYLRLLQTEGLAPQ